MNVFSIFTEAIGFLINSYCVLKRLQIQRFVLDVQNIVPVIHHLSKLALFNPSSVVLICGCRATKRWPRIREHIGSVIGGRVPATQGSSGPCVYCRKPGVRSLYTYVCCKLAWEKLYTQSKELGPMQQKSHHKNYIKSLYMSGLWRWLPRAQRPNSWT